MKDQEKTREQLILELADLRQSVADFKASEIKHQQMEQAWRERETRIRLMVQAIHDAIIAIDSDGNIMFWNKGARSMFGWEEDEILGKPLSLLIPGRYREDFAKGMEQLNLTGESQMLGSLSELEGLRADGSEFSAELSLEAVKVGEDTFYTAVVRDITEQVNAERALRQSEELHKTLIENAFDGIAILDHEGTILHTSPAVESFTGYEAEEVLGRNILEFIHPEDLNESIANLARILQSPSTIVETCSTRIRHKNGPWRSMHAKTVNLLDNPIIKGFVSNFRDITEWEQAQEAIRISEERYRSLFEHSMDAILMTDDEGRYVDANPAACALLCYNREDLLKMTVWDITPIHDRELGREMWESFIATKEHSGEYNLMRKGGTTVETEYRAVANILPGLHLFMLHDITERKKAEEQLLQFETIVVHAKDAVVVTESEPIDPPGPRILYVNDAFTSMTGYQLEQVLGKSPRFLQGPGTDRTQLDRIRSGLIKREPIRAEVLNYRKDGSEFWVELYIVPIFDKRSRLKAWVAVQRDTTERRQAEEVQRGLLEQVLAGRERLQILSRQLVEIQEVERRQIARELHDEIGHALSGLRLILEIAAHSSDDDDTLVNRLGQAQELIEQLSSRVHDLSLDLRPPMLDDLGLLPTLLWHFERYTDQTGIRVDLHHKGMKKRRFSPEIETAVYRIAQETLTNVARHAGVDEVMARLWVDSEVLGFQIEDQGVGFNPEGSAGSTSIGILGMRERVHLLGGRFEIVSAPGAGTTVTAKIPLGDQPVEKREMAR